MKTAMLALFLALPAAAWAQRREGALKVGDDAPNFKAKVIGEKTEVELKKVIEKEKKPVVLIFGSYT
jgi:hypothetical protein